MQELLHEKDAKISTLKKQLAEIEQQRDELLAENTKLRLKNVPTDG